MATRVTDTSPAGARPPAGAGPAGDSYQRYQLLLRMGTKADRDGRAVEIARALGCQRATRQHLHVNAIRSHRAWERAQNALVEAQMAATADPSSYVHRAHNAQLNAATVEGVQRAPAGERGNGGAGSSDA